MKICLRLLLLLALRSAAAFKFMSNWKMPTPATVYESFAAADKFGDKKLVVITGTSSGLGRKVPQALDLHDILFLTRPAFYSLV